MKQLIVAVVTFVFLGTLSFGDTDHTRLKEISFTLEEVEFLVGQRNRTIRIRGDGHGTVVDSRERTEFTVPRPIIVELVRVAIEQRFFELDHTYVVRYELQEADNGWRARRLPVPSHMSVTQVRVRLGDLEHSVIYANRLPETVPRVLVELTARIDLFATNAETNSETRLSD